MGGLFEITLWLKKRKTWKLMPRGVETSLSGVVFAARGTYKSFKKRFYESIFFEWFFGVEKGGGPSEECNELSCGPLQEDIL